MHDCVASTELHISSLLNGKSKSTFVPLQAVKTARVFRGTALPTPELSATWR